MYILIAFILVLVGVGFSINPLGMTALIFSTTVLVVGFLFLVGFVFSASYAIIKLGDKLRRRK